MADDNGSSSMIVALVAILVIIAVGFLVLRMGPLTPADNGGNGGSIEVDLGSSGGSDGQ